MIPYAHSSLILVSKQVKTQAQENTVLCQPSAHKRFPSRLWWLVLFPKAVPVELFFISVQKKPPKWALVPCSTDLNRTAKKKCHLTVLRHLEYSK